MQHWVERTVGDSLTPLRRAVHQLNREPALSIFLALATIGVLITAVVMALRSPYLGDDVWPLLRAGHAVRDHKSPYDAAFSKLPSNENAFVYLPSAAIVFTPLSYLSRTTASSLMVLLNAASLLAWVGILTRRFVARRWIILLGALGAALVLSSLIAAETLPSGNVTILLVLPAFWIIELWVGDRWKAGALLLSATLLIKPLLLPLLLIPLVRRQWKAVVLAVLPAAVLTVLASWATGTLSDLPRLFSFLASGNGLTGNRAAFNISLRAFGQVHGLEPLTFVLRGVALGAVCYCLWRFAVGCASFHVMGWVLLLGAFLAGSVSEPHYMFLVLPAAYELLSQRRSGWVSAMCLTGLLLLAFPRGFTGDIALLQVRHVATEIILFVPFVAYFTTAGGFQPLRQSRTRVGPQVS
jgi:arabinofuranan 3-O-arabinosyltransferase